MFSKNKKNHRFLTDIIANIAHLQQFLKMRKSLNFLQSSSRQASQDELGLGKDNDNYDIINVVSTRLHFRRHENRWPTFCQSIIFDRSISLSIAFRSFLKRSTFSCMQHFPAQKLKGNIFIYYRGILIIKQYEKVLLCYTNI